MATVNADATAVSVVVQGDGKILVLDRATPSVADPMDAANHYDLVRFNTDGSLDDTFGDHGKVAATFGDGWEGYLTLVLLIGLIGGIAMVRWPRPSASLSFTT